MGWVATAPEAIATAIHTGLSAAGMYIQRDARLRCPVDTGRLRSSITYATQREVSSTRGPASKPGDAVSRPTDPMTLHVGTNVEYAAHVEYGVYAQSGHGGMTVGLARAQPYLRPALDENRTEIQGIFAKYLQKSLREGAARSGK